MDKLDLPGLPTWAVILLAILTSTVTPIILAWLSNARGKRETPTAIPSTPVEVGSPWLVQNLLEMKITGERTLHVVEALVKAISDLSVQANTLVALLKRRDHHRE